MSLVCTLAAFPAVARPRPSSTRTSGPCQGGTLTSQNASSVSALDPIDAVVSIEAGYTSVGAVSPVPTQFWSALERAAGLGQPAAHTVPILGVSHTSSNHYRNAGAITYGGGLYSERLNIAEFAERSEGGIDERVDIGTLALSTDLWVRLATDLLTGTGT